MAYAYQEANHPRDKSGRWINKDLGSTYGDVFLTADETEALVLYADELAFDLNNRARAGMEFHPNEQKWVGLLDNAIAKQTLKEDTHVYRGLKNNAEGENVLASLKVGDVIEHDGYTSTSLEYSVASHFSYDENTESEGVIMNITGKKGHNAIELTSLMAEDAQQEVLFPRNQKLRFTGLDDDGEYLFETVK